LLSSAVDCELPPTIAFDLVSETALAFLSSDEWEFPIEDFRDSLELDRDIASSVKLKSSRISKVVGSGSCLGLLGDFREKKRRNLTFTLVLLLSVADITDEVLTEYSSSSIGSGFGLARPRLLRRGGEGKESISERSRSWVLTLKRSLEALFETT
jgi:hypothetical protein